jgi:hypothetical protein
MQSWTFVKNGKVGVVTADNIDVAKDWLIQAGIINVDNIELVPLPTHHRHVRIINAADPQDKMELGA